MSTNIDVRPLGPERFAVDIREGELFTTHKVAVHSSFLDDLGIFDIDPAEVVHESIAFLLEREPAPAIAGDFPLEQIAEHFPDYYDELRTRLGV
jgi:hypothetical protein